MTEARRLEMRFKFAARPYKGVKDAIVDAADFAARKLRIHGQVSIRLTPRKYQSIRDERTNKLGFACFKAPDYKGEIPVIVVAQGLKSIIDKDGGNGTEALQESLIHELLHFEQYCCEMPLIEKGIERRTRRLMRELRSTPRQGERT